MDDFARALAFEIRASFGKSDYPKVNPFVVIGLTQTILDLNLTEEQLYAAVRSYVRQLASQVHPDRKPVNVSEERQKQIFAALEDIDDKERFFQALTEFRNLKSEERNEINLLNASLVAARMELDEVREKYSLSVRTLDEIKQRESALIKKENEVAVKETSRKILEREAYSSQKKLAVTERSLRRCLAEKVGCNRYISEMGAIAPASGGVHACDAKWVAVAHLSENKIPKEESMYKAMRNINLGGFDPKSVMESFALMSSHHCNDSPTGRGELTLSVFSLSAGRLSQIYGEKVRTDIYRVIGSIAPTKDRSPYVRQQREAVLAGLSVFLLPGNIMVRGYSRAIEIEKTQNLVYSTRFETEYVILAVG